MTCEDILLHYLLPTEFVDSPEWESCTTNNDKRFQVRLVSVLVIIMITAVQSKNILEDFVISHFLKFMSINVYLLF